MKKFTFAQATKEAMTHNRASIGVLAGDATELHIERARLEAKLAARIDEIRAEFSPKLDANAVAIANHEAIMRAWATLNKATEFAGKRSIEFERGTLLFRTEPPQVDTLKGWTLKTAVLALKAVKWGAQYLRPREPDLNKEAILADREKLSRDQLAGVGLAITQDDVFKFEPRIEEAAVPTP